MRRENASTLTEADILDFDNVPPAVAAKFIGWSSSTVYQALQQERAPFGFAVRRGNSDVFTYNISPGLLVAYKRGTLPTYKLAEVEALAVDGITRLFEAKLELLNERLRGAVQL